MNLLYSFQQHVLCDLCEALRFHVLFCATPFAMHVDFDHCFYGSSYFNLTILCGKMRIRFHKRFKSALFPSLPLPAISALFIIAHFVDNGARKMKYHSAGRHGACLLFWLCLRWGSVWMDDCGL